VSVSASAQEKVDLTIWAWTPNTQAEIDLFTKAFPHISVKLENAGQGPDEYVKLRNAIQAGSGLPDLGQVEFSELFQASASLQALLDMASTVPMTSRTSSSKRTSALS